MNKTLERIVLITSGIFFGSAITSSAFLFRNQENIPIQTKNSITAIYFSPQDNCSRHIIELVNNAKESVFLEIYTFTDKQIADALISAYKRGVRVRILFDTNQASIKPSLDEYLQNTGLEISYDREKGIMHNKVLIVDGEIVSTGSFNYTLAANSKNNENLVIIRDKETARKYSEEFDRLWRNSKR